MIENCVRAASSLRGKESNSTALKLKDGKFDKPQGFPLSHVSPYRRINLSLVNKENSFPCIDSYLSRL